MPNVDTVSGKVIVVTGGANGIGLAVVENFIRKGAKTVVILDLDSNAGNRVSLNLIRNIYGVIITPFIPTYHATKHGVYAFSKSLGHSFNYKITGVKVIALCPGYTRTNLLNGASLMDEDLTAALDKEPKIWQETDAVGAAAVEVFENSASGLAWQIVGNKPIVEV